MERRRRKEGRGRKGKRREAIYKQDTNGNPWKGKVYLTTLLLSTTLLQLKKGRYRLD
jgi:hypothetical protein